jgi:hypothetical protein
MRSRKVVKLPVLILVGLSVFAMIALGESRQAKVLREREDVVLPPIYITVKPDDPGPVPRLVVRDSQVVADTGRCERPTKQMLSLLSQDQS